MSNIVVSIYTTKFIGEEHIAQSFFKILSTNGFTPERIGLYEPLREPFSLQKFIEMWTREEEGCYEDGVGMVGKAGGMIGKLRDPSFKFYVYWWKHPNKTMINNLKIFVNAKSFRKSEELLLQVFKETVALFEALYGYISHEVPQNRQHVTGSIETRIPGVFWCNYFSDLYLDFFGREKFFSFDWYKTEIPASRGAFAYLADDPIKGLVDSEELEVKARRHLGEDSFGDIDEYHNDPTKTQYRNVPIIS